MTDYIHRWFVGFSVLSFFCLALGNGVVGADDGPYSPPPQVDGYSVSGIVVDVPDQSAKAAKEKAIVAAYRQGFLALLHEMASRADLGADGDKGPDAVAAAISELDLDGLVQDFEIEREKQSTVRYMATFQVRFNGDKVNQFIQNYLVKKEGGKTDIPDRVYGAPASGTLVIPIVTKGDETRVWDDDNQWFHRLNTDESLDGKTFILPVGDLDDRTLFSVKKTDEMALVPLDPLMDHYGVGRVILAQLIMPDTAGEGGALNLFYGAKGVGVVHFETVDLGLGKGDLLTAARDGMIASWHSFLKSGGNGRIRPMSLSVVFDDGDEWRRIQEKIRRIPLIKRLSVKSLQIGRADIELSHVGMTDALVQAFQGAGFYMAGDQKNSILSMAPKGGAVEPGPFHPISSPMVVGLMNHPVLKNVTHRPD